ncbi:MAG: AraC family transcriptional regulator [Chitinophagales bacterium]|nr:AraC family transcriptional regulator [Chitinophagales bacterium]
MKVTLVELGEVEVSETVTDSQIAEAKQALEKVGFELLDDQKQKLVEGIKNAVVEMIHYHKTGEANLNYSQVIANKLNKDYTYLSNLFSELEGSTIEKYIILQRIERAKELIGYGQLSLTEIAEQLGYSSVAYLSNQFKKVTGLTPTAYKEKGKGRKSLDKV